MKKLLLTLAVALFAVAGISADSTECMTKANNDAKAKLAECDTKKGKDATKCRNDLKAATGAARKICAAQAVKEK